MIIMTEVQADMVRGETIEGHAIMPVRLNDGSYCVSEAVLSDPAHAAKHDLLSSMPKRLVEPSEFPSEE
jgi:hypothetical protein